MEKWIARDLRARCQPLDLEVWEFEDLQPEDLEILGHGSLGTFLFKNLVVCLRLDLNLDLRHGLRIYMLGELGNLGS